MHTEPHRCRKHPPQPVLKVSGWCALFGLVAVGVAAGTGCGGGGFVTQNEKSGCDTPWGKRVAHDSTVAAYSKASVPAGTSCAAVTTELQCFDGLLVYFDAALAASSAGSIDPMVAFPYGECTPEIESPKTCATPWGEIVAVGTFVHACDPAAGASCACVDVACDRGPEDFGTYTRSSCPVASALDCDLPWGGSIPNGETKRAYGTESVPYGSTCQAETRVCRDGTLVGSYTFEDCMPAEAAGCTLASGEVIPNGGVDSRTRYAVATVLPGASCESESETQTRTCNAGVWAAWTGTFTEPECNVRCADNAGSACDVQVGWQAFPGCEGNDICASFQGVYYNSPNGCDPNTAGSFVEYADPRCTYVGSVSDPFHAVLDGGCTNASERGYGGENTYAIVRSGTGCTHDKYVTRPGTIQCDGRCQ
ncbi:MAG: hypothetical protein H6729_07840 [Deltaproteobacteria bacterium]|nr:hypothetical protein [Deltaproteobacteria bacterium]